MNRQMRRAVEARARADADDPQLPIAQTLGADLVDIIKRRVVKYEGVLKGQGITYALTLAVTEVMMALSATDEQFGTWSANTLQELQERRTRDLAAAAAAKAPTS